MSFQNGRSGNTGTLTDRTMDSLTDDRFGASRSSTNPNLRNQIPENIREGFSELKDKASNMNPIILGVIVLLIVLALFIFSGATRLIVVIAIVAIAGGLMYFKVI